jgi:hypothetical protein
MTPLDLRRQPPRPARETLLGFYLLPPTIDKLRAEPPGGHLGTERDDLSKILDILDADDRHAFAER